uniref:EF-hand domain-containing protein n=1 Tax=Meloidogyne hapla TaxID=6305 RepID=A0A1I8BSP9_MELHA
MTERNLLINNIKSTNDSENKEENEKSSTDQFNQLFQQVDANNDDSISLEEATNFWKEKSKQMDPTELKEKITKQNAKTLEEAVEKGFKKVDKNDNGKISKEELFEYMNN